MIINKAQGQIIHIAGIYIFEHVYAHGQLYVALSREVSSLITKILVKAEKKRKKCCETFKNISTKKKVIAIKILYFSLFNIFTLYT